MSKEPYYPELIHSYEQKERRRADTRLQICELSRDEFYTVTEVIIYLCGYRSRQGADTPRVCRRLINLRELVYEQKSWIFP